MKLIKLNSKLNEAIENIGSKKISDWGDHYTPEVDPVPQAVMPVSFVAAVEQVKRWREEANKKIEERRKFALKVIDANDEDRFKHMSDREKQLNKGEKTSLEESLLKEDVVKIDNEADKLLIKLALAGFTNWQQLALDLLDSMSDEEVDKFVSDYNYEVDTSGVEFEDEKTRESLQFKKLNEDSEHTYTITPGNLVNFKPWGGAVSTWRQVIDHGSLDTLSDVITELYPDEIDNQTLNDLLWFDSDFIFSALDMYAEGDSEEEVEEVEIEGEGNND